MAGSLFESGDKIGGMSQDDLSSFVQQQITNPMWAALKNADNQRMLAPDPPPQTANQVPVWDGSKWVAQLIAAASFATGALPFEAYYQPSTSTQTITNSAADVTGATVTLVNPGKYFCLGIWDFQGTATGWTTATGQLNVSGSTVGIQAVLGDTGTAAARATIPALAVVTTGSANQTFKLTTQKNAAGGTLTLQAQTALFALRLSAP